MNFSGWYSFSNRLITIYSVFFFVVFHNPTFSAVTVSYLHNCSVSAWECLVNAKSYASARMSTFELSSVIPPLVFIPSITFSNNRSNSNGLRASQCTIHVVYTNKYRRLCPGNGLKSFLVDPQIKSTLKRHFRLRFRGVSISITALCVRCYVHRDTQGLVSPAR